MKKTLFTLIVMSLFIGTTVAQTKESRSALPAKTQYYQKTEKSSRAVVYTEGFEATANQQLPTGWISIPENIWITIDSTAGQIESVSSGVVPHGGDRCMARSWKLAGRSAWAISNGIELTQGEAYAITFWFRAPGYPGFDEYDDFEVRIGQTPTNTAMNEAHLLFSNILTRINPWTLAECFFLAPTTGTYYLGFHDLNAGEEGIFITIDDIEITSGICLPVSNLVATYTDCSKVSLSWTSPDPSANLSYKVLRDGTEIAVVETESYEDLDFEPTLEHTWSVIVACEDENSMAINVFLEACEETSCTRAKKLTVTYDENCDVAKLTWYAPTDVLWDNTEMSMSGYPSARWLWEENSRDILADDFDVFPGEQWTISELYYTGFHVTVDEPFDAPDFIGVEIFDDNGAELPGTQIYENTELLPYTGNGTTSEQFATILFPEPIEITAPGKYWISIYGVYNNQHHASRRYYVTSWQSIVGADMAYLDETESPDWGYFGGASMFFRLQGYASTDPILYNIYRDGELIASDITELTFEDTDFNSTVAHQWSVRVACPLGDQSPPIYLQKENCETGGSVNENTNIAFSIVPNPAQDKITITADNNFNKIEVINFIGQTVIALPNTYDNNTIDISNLKSGVYFVRITSENGTAVQKFVKQ